MFSLLISMFIVQGAVASAPGPEDEIKEVIYRYIKMADQQNTAELERLMSDDFRVLWHDENSPDNMIVPKSMYLDKIRSKEWGGDSRKLSVEEILYFDNTNATVKLKLTGSKSTMRSFLSLVKREGSWVIVQDLVTASFK